MDKVQAKRLLNVAKALRESKNPGAFTMRGFVHGDWCLPNVQEGFCGTPACALGHYAARRDLQKLLFVDVLDDNVAEVRYSSNGFSCDVSGDAVLDHFGIDELESVKLFDSDGCGNAKTPRAAARYIERFVQKKQKGQGKS